MSPPALCIGVERFRKRLMGRIAMNVRTAAFNSDIKAKQNAEARIAAYETAMLDLESIFALALASNDKCSHPH